MQEPVFSSHAKVAHCEEAHFFKDEFSGKLKLDGSGAEEVLEGKRTDLHDVSDV